MSGIIGKREVRGSGVVSRDITPVKSVSGSIGVVADSDIDHDSLTNVAANEHYTQANITAVGTVTTGTLNSGVNIKAAIGASGSAPIYACRAWVNFNGTGTVAERDSGNVSSITDTGTGDYTVNYTTAVPSNNSVVATGGFFGCSVEIDATPGTSSVDLVTKDIDASVRDADVVCVAVFA